MSSRKSERTKSVKNARFGSSSPGMRKTREKSDSSDQGQD